MQILNITRWPLLLVFLGAGATATLLAFSSINLFALALANFGFLRDAGWDAIRHGALRQTGGLAVNGAVALACWLGFKVFETELILRYRRWAEQPR